MENIHSKWKTYTVNGKHTQLMENIHSKMENIHSKWKTYTANGKHTQ